MLSLRRHCDKLTISIIEFSALGTTSSIVVDLFVLMLLVDHTETELKYS